jgi:hypothetical protein
MARRRQVMTATATLELSQIELVKYSLTEERIFAILKSLKGATIDTEELTRKFYKGKVPMHGRTIISGTFNKLIDKVERNCEVRKKNNWPGFETQFRICRSERSGPISTVVWITKR